MISGIITCVCSNNLQAYVIEKLCMHANLAEWFGIRFIRPRNQRQGPRWLSGFHLLHTVDTHSHEGLKRDSHQYVCLAAGERRWENPCTQTTFSPELWLIMYMRISPRHWSCWRRYPLGHWHLYEPGVLTQIAGDWQPWYPLEHSSISNNHSHTQARERRRCNLRTLFYRGHCAFRQAAVVDLVNADTAK